MSILKVKTDRLFAEKIENHTIKPRAEAWAKLESRLEQKHRKITPIWQQMGKAASVLILLFVGGVTYFKNSSKLVENQPIAANSKPNETVDRAKSNTEIANFMGEKKEEIEQISPAINLEKQDKPKTLIAHRAILANNTKFSINDKSIEIEKKESKTTNFAHRTLRATPDLSNNGLVTDNISTDIPDNQIVEYEKPEALTIVFTVANFEKKRSALNNQLEKYEVEKKPKYLARFFKQIINAKNGDRVDWNEVGFKPAKILARAEDKLKSTKDELSGSYQSVKNKTVL